MKARGLVVLFTIVASPAGAQGLSYPVDVAVNAKGEVYVADHEAHALLKWEGGAFKVVAKDKGLPRTPLYGIRHITFDKEGRVVASDPATMKLYRLDPSGAITPIADDDRFVTPWGVAVEPSGDILAVDRVTHQLRRVKADGKVSEVAKIQAPRAIFFDAEGAILVLTDKNIVRVGASGATEPLLQNPPFQFPHDAVRHPNGNLYVTDGYARAVWQVAREGQAWKVTALVQGDPLKSPQGIALDGKGNLLVADAHAKAIFQITVKGEITPFGR